MADAAAFGPSNLPSFPYPEALREPEKLISAYFSSTTVGLCILDSELRFLAINHALAEMNGIPASEHLGKTVREVLGNFADNVEPRFQKALAGEPALNCEVSGVLPTRTEPGYWVGHYIPITTDQGMVTRIAVVVVEITEKKRLEESHQVLVSELRRQVDRWQMLTDVSTLLTSSWNLQQIFPQISARIRRTFHHEYAGLELHEVNTGLLVRQAEDFPLGKGLLSKLPISTHNSPGVRALRARTPLILTRQQMQSFEPEIAKSFLAEGLKSLCCLPLTQPNGELGVLVLASTRENAFHLDDLILLNQVATQFALALENQRATAELESLKERSAEERKFLEGESHPPQHFPEIVGGSSALKKVLDQVSTVAPSTATVLILGETGTGKELVARAIHRLSRRSDGPFVKVNCAAIPTGLLESELFGHEKGAFTGAVSQKVGRMELAHGGTLFLDEVGEIPLELQPKLLRVLQDQEFERLGSNRTIRVNLRLVAATNRDLAAGIALHQFRSDLFYRLSVFPIHVPPLRDRRDDIPTLVHHYVRKFAQRMERQIETIPRDTMKALTAWSWPGNVRELENLMERSVILSEGTALHVPLADMRVESHALLSAHDHTLDSAEREHIIRVLRETGGTLGGPDGAAQRLGLKRTTLQSKMLRLKITREDYKGA